MAGQQDLRQAFGREPGAVDFGAQAVLPGGAGALPHKDDSLQTIATKMVRIGEIVEKGLSLSKATGNQATPAKTSDPVELAKREMSPSELRMYEAWMGGMRLAEFDPKESRLPRDKFTGKGGSMERWLVGLREMYQTDAIIPENVAWFAVKASFAVPLITAFTKVVSARRSMTVDSSTLSAAELAEYQTARRITAEASFAVQMIMEDINKWNAQIGEANRLIQTRIRYYEPRIKTKPGNEAPLNRERAAFGLSKLGRPSDLQRVDRKRRAVERLGAPEDRAARRIRASSPEYTPQSPTLGAMGGGAGAPPLNLSAGSGDTGTGAGSGGGGGGDDGVVGTLTRGAKTALKRAEAMRRPPAAGGEGDVQMQGQ